MGKITKLQLNQNIEKEMNSNFALTSENIGYTKRIKKLRISKNIEKIVGHSLALTSAGLVGASVTLAMVTSKPIFVPSIGAALGCASLSCLFYGLSILSDMQIGCNEIFIIYNKIRIDCNKIIDRPISCNEIPKTFVKNTRIMNCPH